MVLRKSFYIRWSAGRSPRVHEVNPGRDPSVHFRLRITKNQHKQINPPKLPFQQTEPNEPAGLVFPTGPDG